MNKAAQMSGFIISAPKYALFSGYFRGIHFLLWSEFLPLPPQII